MESPDVLEINGVKYLKAEMAADRAANPTWPWVVGESYMIRTVTFHDHGILVGVTEHEIVLKKAAWIADSGRWWDFITGRKPPNEVEPFGEGEVIIGRGAIVDAKRLPGTYEVQK